jgi:hypothetical protein
MAIREATSALQLQHYNFSTTAGTSKEHPSRSADTCIRMNRVEGVLRYISASHCSLVILYMSYVVFYIVCLLIGLKGNLSCILMI